MTLFPSNPSPVLRSAGLLMYRIKKGALQVFLVHPGGPYYQVRDNGCWGIPKGQVEPTELTEPHIYEDLFVCAQREFVEETSIELPKGKYIILGEVIQFWRLVSVWAFQKNHESEVIKSNTFHMEWPPSSGIDQEFPEVDVGRYF